MTKQKTLITFVLATSLLFSIAVIGQADYGTEVAALLTKSGEVVGQLGNDSTAISRGTMSMATALKYAKHYQNQAFTHLTAIIELTPQAPDKNYHVELVNMLSAVCITTQMWEKVLVESDMDKLTTAIELLDYITRKTNQLRPKLQTEPSE